MAPPKPPRFSELIAMLDAGCIDDAATLDLARLVEEVHERGKPAKLVLTLHVEPRGMNNHMTAILAELKAEAPKPPRAGSEFFVGDHGSLHRRDPYQQSIPTTENL